MNRSGPCREPAVRRLCFKSASFERCAVRRGGAGDLVALDHSDLFLRSFEFLEEVEEEVDTTNVDRRFLL